MVWTSSGDAQMNMTGLGELVARIITSRMEGIATLEERWAGLGVRPAVEFWKVGDTD
jgi:hypothetical protein